jgi:TolB-like protein
MIAVFALILFLLVPLAHAQNCTSSPNLPGMDANFLLYLKSLNTSKKDKIAIIPFFDNHVGNPDDVLYYGIPFLFYDMFSSKNTNIVHPYVSFNAVKTMGLSGEKLIDLQTVREVANKLDVRYLIFGHYQHSFAQTTRLVINVMDVKKDKVLAPAMEFNTEVNDSFFDLFYTNIIEGFKRLTKKRALHTPTYKMPSMRAFRFYSKGHSYAAHYSSQDLEIAALWFEKGLKESYQVYDDAALSLARTHFMLALIGKLKGHSYAKNWTSAQRALSFVKYSYRKMPQKFLLTHRFIEGQNIAAQALTAYVVKNYNKANQQAQTGLGFVPEDGQLQNIYQVTLKGKKPINTIVINNPICF